MPRIRPPFALLAIAVLLTLAPLASSHPRTGTRRIHSSLHRSYRSPSQVSIFGYPVLRREGIGMKTRAEEADRQGSSNHCGGSAVPPFRRWTCS